MAGTSRKNQKTSRDIQADERRNQILTVAKKLFAENGYHATSIRTINRQVGVSDALTYHYFPGGKSEILDTIIIEAENRRANTVDHSIQSIPDDMSLRDALMLLISKLAENFENNMDYFLILIREKNKLSPKQQLMLANTGEKFYHTLMDFLQKRAAAGQIRKMDLTKASSQFLHHIGSIALHQMMFGPGFKKADFLQTAESAVDFTAELWST